jgi:predicted LPLAT superfamily acyltransferase
MAHGPERAQNPGGERRERKRGNDLGIWFFMVLLRSFGLRGAYGLLYVVSLHYVLFDRALVASTLPYIRRRFPGCAPLRERLHAYRLIVSQGKQLIDRYAAVSGHDVFEVQLEADEALISKIRDPKKGAILLTSHQGNWQLAMVALGDLGKAVHLVMVPDQNPAMQKILYPEEEGGNVGVISPERYLGGVIEIMKVLKKGHLVSIMGDRRYGARAVEVEFLGDKAWFPYGAFSVAASAECPLVVLETAKVSTYRYVVDLTNVLYPRYEGRRDRVGQLQPWVQKFVTLTESFLEEHPYQCFLFRDVWKEDPDGIPA